MGVHELPLVFAIFGAKLFWVSKFWDLKRENGGVGVRGSEGWVFFEFLNRKNTLLTKFYRVLKKKKYRDIPVNCIYGS